VVPSLILLIVEGTHAGAHSVPIDDFALLVRHARDALHGHALLGAWSRYGWQHPGPTLFYWWAPFLWLSGHEIGGLALGMVVLNGVLIGSIVAVAGRVAGRWAAWAACLVLVVFNLSYGADRLPEVWNPNTTIYPLIALAVVGAALVAQRRWALPVLAGLASLTVQNHFGTAPVEAVFLVVLLSLAAWQWRSELRRLVAPGVASLGVLATLWALPIFEQLTHHPGNLGKLVQFSLHAKDTSHTWSQIRVPVVSMLSLSVPHTSKGLAGWGANAPQPRALDELVIALLVVGCAAGIVVATRWHRRYELALCAAGLVGVPACFVAASRVSGDIALYVVVFCYSVAAIGWMGVASIGAEALRRQWARVGGGLPMRAVVAVPLLAVVLGTLSLGWSDAHAVPTGERRNDVVAARFTHEALDALQASGGTRKLQFETDLANGAHDLGHANGVILQLEERGYGIGMSWWWATELGRGIIADGREVTRLSLLAAGHPPPGLLGPSDRLVASHDGLDLYIGPMPPHGPSVPPPGAL
jgi:hypothetical protein